LKSYDIIRMHDIKDIAIGGDVLLFLKGANDCVLYNTQIMVFSFFIYKDRETPTD